jgi:hypothetical protein
MPATLAATEASTSILRSTVDLPPGTWRVLLRIPFPSGSPSQSVMDSSSPAFMSQIPSSKGTVTRGLDRDLRKSTSVTASPGHIATHFSHPMHPLLYSGVPRIGCPDVPMRSFGQDVMQGLQGISCVQCRTGNTPSRESGTE